MLFELRAAEPKLAEVQTWHALEKEPMLKVNAELGFQPDREWREYEADVARTAEAAGPARRDPSAICGFWRAVGTDRSPRSGQRTAG